MSRTSKKIEGETKTLSVIVPKKIYDSFKERGVMPSVFIREMLEKEMEEVLRNTPGGSHPARVKSIDAAMQIIEECLNQGGHWKFYSLIEKIQNQLDVRKATAVDYFEQIRAKEIYKSDGYTLWKEIG